MTGLCGVNRPFEAFVTVPGDPGNWPQKPPRAAEGLPSPVRSDSIEARENTHLREKIKGLSTGLIFVSRERPRPERRRLSSGRLAARQPPLSRNFRPLRKLRILTKTDRREVSEGCPSEALWRCWLTLGDVSVLFSISRPYGPSIFRRSFRPRAGGGYLWGPAPCVNAAPPTFSPTGVRRNGGRASPR